MTKCRVGIFGGSFSPPHLGHLRGAEHFIEAEKLDKLYVIPAYLSPGKTEDGIDPIHRLNMCRLAFESLPAVQVLDIEILRGGVSYTVDTLSALARDDRELIVLCGTDTALALDTWKDPAELFRLARFVCMPRDESEITTRLKEKNEVYARAYGAEVKLLSALPYPISSTAIRRFVKAGDGEAYRAHLVSAVADYIEQNRLYQ